MQSLKEKVGKKAAQLITNGMVVGLGTGSTAACFVAALGKRVKNEGLSIVGVTTSSETYQQAQSLGIPLKAIDEVEMVDITIDGADEVDPFLNGIKGGGGALLMEKIVATYSKDYVWIIDSSKLVRQLGTFKLPVEVVPYGADNLYRHFMHKGYRPSFREVDGKRVVTDMQHYIIDLDLQTIADSQALARELDKTVGVVEHGLFNQMVSRVIVAGETGIEILER